MKTAVINKISPLILLVFTFFIIGYAFSSNSLNCWYPDADGDGFGSYENRVQSRTKQKGYTDNSRDCDDTNPNINPFAKEIPNNSIDEDCNGRYAYKFYKDADGDSFGDISNSKIFEIHVNESAPYGYVFNNTDCDDTNPNANPIVHKGLATN